MHRTLIASSGRAVRVIVTAGIALVLIAAFFGSHRDVVSAQSPAVTVFEGARLIAGDGSAPLKNATFIVRNGKIDQVGRRGAVQVPNGAARVDLTGKTVMPVLINLHGHIGYLKGGTMDPKNYSREQILDELRRHEYYGVGAVQILGTGRNGLEVSIRDEQRSGVLKDPSLALLFTADDGIVAPNGSNPNGGPAWAVDVMREAGTEAQGRQHVRELAAKKVDVIKMWVDDRNGRFPKLKPEVYRAIIDEAHKLNVKVMAHATKLEDAKDLARSGIDGMAHPVRSGPIDDELIQLMKAHNVFQCSTSTTGLVAATLKPGRNPWIDDPALAETIPPAIRALMKPQEGAGNGAAQSASYKNLLQTLKRESDAGIRIVLCGDEGTSVRDQPGFKEHTELEALVDGGIAPLQVIRAATEVPAAILGLRDMGTLAPGKRADFIVLNANPLDRMANTQNIMAVYKDGQAVNRTALRERLMSSASSQ